MPDSEYPRPLRSDERALLDEVLKVGLPDRHDIRAALADALVTKICDCGCGSFDLTVNASALPADFDRLVVDQTTPVGKVEGAEVGTLLFVEPDEARVELVWYCEEHERPQRLPRPHELEAPKWREVGEDSWTLENFKED